MSSTSKSIFMTGATGYIGGAVLSRLLARPELSSLNITALVRSAAKAETLQTLGVTPVVGSHSEYALVEKLASEADIIIAAADSDDLLVAHATLRGIKKRFEATGVAPIFIHTSGTGVLADKAGGMYASEVVYTDTDLAQMDSIAPTQVHRNVDLALINADAEGYVRTYIVLPGTVYGIASGKLVDLGVQNPVSVQLPIMFDVSVERGQAWFPGEGRNIWPNVHIDDLSELYLTLFETILSNPAAAGHGREGLYFGENGEHKMADLAGAIGRALFELSLVKNGEATALSKEEMDKYFGGIDVLGTNARCRAVRGRSIGWRPSHEGDAILSGIKAEIEYGKWEGALGRFRRILNGLFEKRAAEAAAGYTV